MDLPGDLFRKLIVTCSATLLLAGACGRKEKRVVETAFYYWKSVYRLSASETRLMDKLSASRLYMKFFDVDWNETSRQPEPVALLQWADSMPPAREIVPVVFITNECLARTDSFQVPVLAGRLVKLVSDMVEKEHIGRVPELQLDCDWTEGTKDKYFQLLRIIKAAPFLKGRELTATIRLYQLKFSVKTGVPPADRGLLMCYNMGNLKNPATQNSILEMQELQKYIANLGGYKLPLDLALPLFNWYVWFSDMKLKGLLYASQLPVALQGREKYVFAADTVVNGLVFKKGDMLRFEDSRPEEIGAAAGLVGPKIRNSRMRLVFFHLDSTLIARYDDQILENIIHRMY